MKFEEVLPALKAGKKAKRTKWLTDYITIDGAIIWHTSKNSCFYAINLDCDHILADDWEIVDE